MTRITVLQIRRGHLFVSGRCPGVSPGAGSGFTILNEKNEVMDCTVFRAEYYDKADESGAVSKEAYCFRADLPVYGGARYRFLKSYEKGGKVKKDKLAFGLYSRLQGIADSYFEEAGHIYKCIGNEIRIYTASFKMRIACEYRLRRTLRKDGKREILQLRKEAKRVIKHKTKPIIIISDRVNLAGDNGEALFAYLMANGFEDKYDIYYAIRKDSVDYDRVKKIGRTLDFGSREHKVMMLAADKIVTAGFDRFFTDPDYEDHKYLADMLSFEHHFLQHGVTMNDWAKALNVTAKAFSTICTVSEREHQAFLDGGYGYNEDEVRLTGFARYDKLEDKPEKLIVFLPSWRAELAGEIDIANGSRFYSEKIKGSEYHTFYQSLISDERILELLKKNGFRGEFYLHPSFLRNTDDFEGNDVIKVLEDRDYSKIFKTASILVTDYSSVNIDFAYLGKPVIYSQFDKDTFFGGHGCDPGYFDYELDGFGPVCTTVDEVCGEIEKAIGNGCRADDKYMERIDSFFCYRDRDNCKRIAQAILGDR